MKKERLFRTVLLMVLLCTVGTRVWASVTDYTSRMSSAQNDWTSATGAYDGGAERYNGNDNAFAVGNVLTQTINNLPNGYFEVEFYAWENFSNWNDNANIAYGNGKAQVFANVSVEDIHVIKNTGGRAFDDANTYKLLALVTEGTLTYGIKNIAAGGNWAVCKPKSLTFLGAKVDDNTDLTSAINNYHFVNCENNAFPGWTIHAPNGGNTWKNGDTRVEYWIGSAANGIFDYYQTLSNLPGGKYSLSASMWNSTDNESKANFNGGGICGVYGTSSNGTAFAGVTVDTRDNSIATYTTTDGVIVTDGTLRIGVKNNGTMTARWFGVDWITLKYLGSCLINEAETLPTTDLTADKWYVYNIPTEDDYEITSSVATTLTYTQDGTLLASTAAGTSETFTAGQTKTIHLSAGTVYIKSSAASTISVSYKYNVGTATSSHAYIQGGETVTISWVGASTNDPSASFAKNGNPTITFGGNSIAVTTTSNGFTFTAPAVTAGTSYTLSIPSNAFGYAAGSTYNAAQEITIKAPELFDGTYFFKDDNNKFWLRGEPYGSAVQVYDWGMPVKVTTDATATTLQFADASDWKIFSDKTGIYADNTSPDYGTWTIIKSGTKYIFKVAVDNNQYHYMKVDDTRILSTATEGDATAFTLVTPAEHQAVLTAYVNAQASAAANAASLSASTPAELQTAANGINATTVIEGSTAATTAEKWQGGQWDNRTVYSNTVNVTTPGLYKFTIQGFYRMTDNDASYALHTAQADCPPVYVFFGDAKTPIKSVMDESRATAYEGNNCDYAQGSNHYPNQQASSLVAFQEGKYANTVWAYLDTAGDYTYGIQYLGWAGSHSEWTCYTTESVSLTLYYSGSLDYVEDGIHYYKGAFDTTPTIELTDAVPVADLTDATFSGTASVTFTNPNGLVFANATDQVNSTTKNVVVNGTCASLQLEKGHPFVNPTQFTASSAKYTMKDNELADGSYATLMLPFAASSLPGSAFALDKGVDLMDGNVRGTATSIVANSPVLVTASGNYIGSNVTIPVVASGTTYPNGELVGTYTAMTAPEHSYVLQNHSDRVAFYLVGSTKPTVNPFRAYIKEQASNVRALQFLFDGETDGLNGVEEMRHGEKVNSVYDLSGRLVRKPTQGVYIRNGKKIVVK